MSYARVGFYTAKPGTLEAILKKAEAELVPMNRQQPGFMRYFMIRSGPDSVVSTTIWQDKQQAEQAAERLSSWVRTAMGPSLVTVDNHVGEVPFSTVPSGTIDGYARVAVWQFKPGTGDAVAERVRTEMVPLMAQQPGFTGYGVARTGENSAVSVTAYASQAQAQAARETIGAWVQKHAMPSVASVERHEGEIIWSVGAA